MPSPLKTAHHQSQAPRAARSRHSFAGRRPQKVTSTQAGFGNILNEIGKSDAPFAERIVTTSPDVTVSTNLGAWVNRRGLFARADDGGHVQEGAHPLDLQLGVLARRASTSSSASPR